MERDVDCEMLQDETMIRGLVEEEGREMGPELSIDEMNQAYDDITEELYKAIA